MKVHELFEQQNHLSKLLLEHCPNNLNALLSGKALPFYRGMDGVDTTYENGWNFAISKERTTPRESLTGSNLFLNFTSENYKWLSLGIDRKYSSFATVDINEALDFGEPFLIIPFDNVTKFAVSTGDFNIMKFGKNQISLNNLIYQIYALLSTIRDINEKAESVINQMDPEVIKLIKSKYLKSEMLMKLDISQKDIKFLSDSLIQLNDLPSNYFTDLIKDENSTYINIFSRLERKISSLNTMLNNDSLFDWLSYNFTPENMEIEVFNEYAYVRAPNDAEIWFRGSYIILSNDNISTGSLYKSSKLKALMQV